MALWTRLRRGRHRLIRWPGRWSFLAVVGSVLVILAGLAGLITAVDPHNLYPWGARPRMNSETLAGPAQSQVLNVVTDGQFDTLLIGASSAQQFEGPDLARHLTGTRRGYAIIYLGAQPRDLSVVMDRVAVAPGLKRVLLSYDLGFMAPADRAQSGFPLAFYDDSPLNDLGAMGPVSLALSWRLLTGRPYTDPAWDLAPLRKGWALRHELSRRPATIAHYRRFMARHRDRLDAPTRLTCDDFPANARIARFAEQLSHRGVALEIIIPPYSYAAYSDLARPERIERVRGEPPMASLLQARRCLIAAVAPYANTRVFGFDLEADIVEDMANYWDTTHLYGPSIGRRMLDAVDQGRNVLTIDSFEPYAAEMRRRVVAWEYRNSRAAP